MWMLIGQQSPSIDPTTLFAQLGIASIVCALLFVALLVLWRKYLEALAEKDKLFLARIEREQVLGTLLADALEILGTVPGRFEAALTAAQRSSQSHDIDQLVNKLERVTGEIERKKHSE